jgi:regulator of replication initiation timing
MTGLSGWITTDVAARAVRLSPRTIRRYIDRGELKAKVEGEGVERRWLVDVDSLHALRASWPESEPVREVSGEADMSPAMADVIRELAARVEERTAEAVEMRVRLELTERAQSTIQEQARKIQEEAQQLREENEQLRQKLEALRVTREAAESAEGGPYGTSRQEAEDSLQRHSSW